MGSVAGGSPPFVHQESMRLTPSPNRPCERYDIRQRPRFLHVEAGESEAANCRAVCGSFLFSRRTFKSELIHFSESPIGVRMNRSQLAPLFRRVFRERLCA